MKAAAGKMCHIKERKKPVSRKRRSDQHQILQINQERN